MAFCGNCGATIFDGTSFCGSCGKSTGSAQQPVATPAVAAKPVNSQDPCGIQ